MRLLLLICFLLLAGGRGVAQNEYFTDSLKNLAATAGKDQEKIIALMSLAKYYAGLDKSLAQQYADKAIEIAELSRDRKMMIETYLQNGDRYLNMAGLSGNIQLALNNYQEAEKISKENGLDYGLVESYCSLARAFREKGETDKARGYSNRAVSIAANLDNDTLKAISYASMGDTYMAMNEKLMAFQNYLESLNIAELSKKDDLLRGAYDKLSDFYSGIQEYDKAIDQSMKVLSIDRQKNYRYGLLGDYDKIGGLFTQKQQYDLALKMYESTIAEADTMRFYLYKINTYMNIFNMYFARDQYSKGMAYLNDHRVVLDFLDKAGVRWYLDEYYGDAYTDLGKFDSAFYFFEKAQPAVEKVANAAGKYEFYSLFGKYYKTKGDDRNAIVYYEKARQVGMAVKDLVKLQNSDANLDTLYGRIGDYKTAYRYNADYNMYRDSIKALSRESDLLKLEVDNDNRRRERQIREEEANTEHRHNVQYMGFTVGLVCLFILLIMMGFFVVHPGTIRALGFFSFIFLFEFIILLSDKQIHEWTHGEPWKVLLIKIFLAAILLPMHHWLEHKMIHYLTSRKKIAAPGKDLVLK